jgi:hypothetical protein
MGLVGWVMSVVHAAVIEKNDGPTARATAGSSSAATYKVLRGAIICGDDDVTSDSPEVPFASACLRTKRVDPECRSFPS